MHGENDEYVPRDESYRLVRALQEHGVSYEAHLFRNAKHACALAFIEAGGSGAIWLHLVLDWMHGVFNDAR